MYRRERAAAEPAQPACVRGMRGGHGALFAAQRLPRRIRAAGTPAARGAALPARHGTRRALQHRVGLALYAHPQEEAVSLAAALLLT